MTHNRVLDYMSY